MTTLSTFGELTTKALKCETDVTFQTANANSTILRATDSSGDQIITIPAQSGNSNLLTSESSVAAAKVDINGASAETSLQDADTFLFYDNSSTSNKKVTGANLKTYVGASGQTSGTSGQIIVFNGSNAQAAVDMSGDVAIDNAGATTIQSGAVETSMVSDDAITAAKLADNAVVNASVDASAAIAYSKLALSNSIVAGDLTTDCVTTAKIQNNAVNAAKIGANQVTNVKIASLAGVSAGTVSATKLMLPDANKDLSGFRNLTSTGDAQSASVLIGTSEWKIVNSGTDLLFQKWNSGTSAWVTKSTISGA